MDLNAQYNNRALVPDHEAVIAGWSERSQAFRDAHGAAASFHYGAHQRQVCELFSSASADDAAPLVVFVHGGYWQALSGGVFAHIAAGANAHGLDVAIPTYRLAPEVGVEDIIRDVREACLALWKRHGRKLVVTGHSAGGHLAACMLATHWAAHDAPADLVQAGFGISGLYDLRPLMATYVNDLLGLDEPSARAASPLLWPTPGHGRFEAWFGGDESAEYQRQSETLIACWNGAGLNCQGRSVAGENHFTVVGHLANPDSKMTARLVELCRQDT